ncbi:MAG: DUF4124 domain-containing protein [Desulfobacterales bacterium]
MTTSRTVLALALLTLMIAPAPAAEIYFWVDEHGVRHYSNTGIPDHVQKVEVNPEDVSTQPEVEAAAEDAPAADDAPSLEELEKEQAARKQKRRENEYREAAAAWDRKIDDEREQLQSQIEAIENRSLGKFFTQGMREAQLKPLEEKLSLLTQNPEAYFDQRGPTPRDFGLTEAPLPR